MKLTPEDFPLKAIGNLIYARMWSSPILTASDPEMAAEIVERLNGESTVMVDTSIRLGRQEP